MFISQCVHQVLSIGIDTRETRILQPMSSARKFPSTLKLDGFIYVIGGGSDDGVELKTIER